ncbi:hypothetical protein HanIR_Chr13g0654961 [Helianthus annuus]|nr:hypothetical protein HanIR_Chr13g0654961 [Helianthus annuus]
MYDNCTQQTYSQPPTIVVVKYDELYYVRLDLTKCFFLLFILGYFLYFILCKHTNRVRCRLMYASANKGSGNNQLANTILID